MDFGLTFEKLLLIGVIAAVLIGPERLPKVAETFARIVRRAGEYLRDTKGRMRDEIGPEIDDVDWRKLDPRQYDPRRIIRDALFEDPVDASPASRTSAAASGSEPAHAPTDPSAAPVPATAAGVALATGAPGSAGPRPRFSREFPPPYDSEAT